MRVFVDTSALYAALVRTDRGHESARAELAALCADAGVSLVTTSFVVLETFSLLQARFGVDAALRFERELVPHLEVTFVDRELYGKGVRRVALRRSRKVSLVDCVSFVFMEEQGIEVALALDKHFQQEGFRSSPTDPP